MSNPIDERRFGRRVAALCEDRGLSQVQLARQIGFTKQRMSKIARGLVKLRPTEIGALEAALPGLRASRPLVGLTVDRLTPVSQLPSLLRRDETAALLACSTHAVRNLEERGELEVRRIGRLVRVTRASLSKFIEGRDATAVEETAAAG